MICRLRSSIHNQKEPFIHRIVTCVIIADEVLSGKCGWYCLLLVSWTGETIDSNECCTQKQEMHEKLRKIQPISPQTEIILRPDNTRPHLSQITVHKLNEPEYEILPHPPCSPDLFNFA